MFFGWCCGLNSIDFFFEGSIVGVVHRGPGWGCVLEIKNPLFYTTLLDMSREKMGISVLCLLIAGQ